MTSKSADDHQLVTVAARSSVELPLSAVLKGGQINVFPEVETAGLLFLQFQGGKIRLTAGKYIGLIPLTPDITVDVRPKLPVRNLARILDHARASLGSVALDRHYETTDDQGVTVLEFLLSNLVSSLQGVQERGYLKNYTRRLDAGALRGRLLAGQTLKSLWSRGERHKVATEAFGQTVDIAANRVIKLAMENAMATLCRVRPTSPILKEANRAHGEFPRSVSPIQHTDLQICRAALKSRSLPASRGYYYRPMEISQLLLSNAAVSLERTGGDIQLQTFILNFEEVFENYLRHVLEMRAPAGCDVRDGNGDGARPLYDDRPDPPAQPDIVLEYAGSRPVIVEVKYKDKPDRADVNQVVTYAAAYRATTVVLVHQAKATAQNGTKLRGTINSTRIYTYGFDLAAHDLEAEEAAFVAAMSAFAQPSLPLVA